MNVEPTRDLEDALLSLLKAVDAGHPPDPATWLARHPEFAPALQDFVVSELYLARIRREHDQRSTLPHDQSQEGDTALAVPASVGRFELGGPLASGGMGDVLRAHDPVLGRDLAVKLMQLRHRDRPELVRRFLAEARIAAGLQHPGVPPVHDVGEVADGRPFIAMKLIEGQTLAALLDARAAPKDDLPRLLKIFEQVAQTIAYAHSKGVIHRDLKPQNVMVGAFGEVQVVDWGLAKQLGQSTPAPSVPAGDSAVGSAHETRSTATRAGSVMGTPAYMPPEQAQGAAEDVDARADVFGLGAILLEILTGSPPFLGPHALVAARAGDLAGAWAGLAVCDADPELVELARHCLAADPARRPATGQAVADRITAHLVGVQTRLRAAEMASARAQEARKRRRLLTAVLAVVVVASLAAAVWLREQRDAAREAETRANSAKADAIQSEAAANRSNKERLQELYRAYLNESRASRLTGQVGQREVGLTAIRKILATVPRDQLKAEQLAEVRDEAIACLANADLKELRRVPFGVRDVYSTDVDESLELMVHSGQQADETRVSSVGAAADRFTFPVPDRTRGHYRTQRRISPNGRWVIEMRLAGGANAPHLRVYDRHAQRFTIDKAVPELAFPPVFSADEGRIFFPRSDSRLQEFDLQTGAARAPSPPRFGTFALSPDGTLAAVASSTRPAEIVRLADWQTVRSFPQFGGAASVAWSPDDGRVVFGSHDGKIWQWDRGLNTEYPLVDSHRMPVERLCFSPDGRLLASSSYPGECVVRQVHGDRPLFSLPGQALRFSKDSRRLAVISGNELVVSELVSSNSLVSLRSHYQWAQFSPDGLLLASSGSLGVDFRTSHDLQFKANLELDDSGPVGFHPSGREFVTFGLFSQQWRWPLAAPEGARAHWQVGPPARAWESWTAGLTHQPQHFGRQAVWSRTGRFMAAADFRNGQVLLWEPRKGELPRVVGKLDHVGFVALSPDEAYVAAGGVIARGAQVWETATHRAVLTVADHSHVAFSTDGRRFVSSSPLHVHVRRVGGDWPLERVFRRERTHENARTPFALQPDGPLLAYATAPGRICLCDRDTGRVIANLTRPDDGELHWLTFSPDGTRLAFVTLNGALGVWNLGNLRTDVESLGLFGGDLPTGRPGPLLAGEIRVERGTKLPPPKQWSKNWLRMAAGEVIDGKGADAVAAVNRAIGALPSDAPATERADLFALRGTYHLRYDDPASAVADWRRALALVSTHEGATKSLARLSLLGPPEHRDARAAYALLAPLANREKHDDEVTALLGIAQVQLARYQDGIRLLNAVPADTVAPFPAWFLARAYQKTGEPSAAARAITNARNQSHGAVPALEKPALAELRAEVEEK
jgi:WD40 repeat protein